MCVCGGGVEFLGKALIQAEVILQEAVKFFSSCGFSWSQMALDIFACMCLCVHMRLALALPMALGLGLLSCIFQHLNQRSGYRKSGIRTEHITPNDTAGTGLMTRWNSPDIF